MATCMLLCASSIVAALAASSTPVRSVLASVGILGFIIVYTWSRQLGARAILEKQKRDEARFEELKREFDILGTPLEVKGSTGLSLSLFLTLSAAATVYFAWSQQTIEVIVLACMMVPIAFFLTLATVPLIGKPVITIRRDGIDTAAYGFLLWNEIDHISLQALSSKGPPVLTCCASMCPLFKSESVGAIQSCVCYSACAPALNERLYSYGSPQLPNPRRWSTNCVCTYGRK